MHGFVGGAGARYFGDMARFEAVLFDKDGTLLDFHGTWDGATGVALRAAASDAGDLAVAARLLGFDLTTDRIKAGSPMLAEANDVLLDLVADHIDVAVFEQTIGSAAMQSIQPARGAVAVLDALQDEGVACAVVTNDWASVTTGQLAALGLHDRFVTVVGSDSGFGAKPDPAMVFGALAAIGVEPSCALLVGDTSHDIRAGQAAGVSTALVTNGSVPDAATAVLADFVITTLDELIPILTGPSHPL